MKQAKRGPKQVEPIMLFIHASPSSHQEPDSGQICKPAHSNLQICLFLFVLDKWGSVANDAEKLAKPITRATRACIGCVFVCVGGIVQYCWWNCWRKCWRKCWRNCTAITVSAQMASQWLLNRAHKMCGACLLS